MSERPDSGPGGRRGLRHAAVEALRDADDWLYERARRMRVLFVFPDPYGFACQAPVAAQLLQQPGVIVRALWDRKGPLASAPAFSSARDEALYRQLRIAAVPASLSKWHVVVDSHLCSFFPRRRALRAYLHHGAGFGSGGGVAAADNCPVYLGLSQAERAFIEGRRPGLFEHEHAFFPIGFPKADVLVDGSYDRSAILRGLGLPERPTILITSHYTPGGILRALGPALFEQLCSAFPSHNVIQTGHPWLWRDEEDELQAWRVDVRAQLDAVLARHAHARVVTDMLAEPLAAAADLLVADAASSALTIFGLLDKPIACYADAALERKGKPGLSHYLDASHVFRELGEALPACRAALAEPQARADGRRAIREIFYPHAGESAQRTAAVLRDIGKVCSVKSPQWPRVMALAAAQRA